MENKQTEEQNNQNVSENAKFSENYEEYNDMPPLVCDTEEEHNLEKLDKKTDNLEKEKSEMKETTNEVKETTNDDDDNDDDDNDDNNDDNEEKSNFLEYINHMLETSQKNHVKNMNEMLFDNFKEKETYILTVNNEAICCSNYFESLQKYSDNLIKETVSKYMDNNNVYVSNNGDGVQTVTVSYKNSIWPLERCVGKFVIKKIMCV